MHVWPHRLPYKSAAMAQVHKEVQDTIYNSLLCTQHRIIKSKLEQNIELCFHYHH
jgi:hypothetical protein